MHWRGCDLPLANTGLARACMWSADDVLRSLRAPRPGRCIQQCLVHGRGRELPLIRRNLSARPDRHHVLWRQESVPPALATDIHHRVGTVVRVKPGRYVATIAEVDSSGERRWKARWFRLTRMT